MAIRQCPACGAELFQVFFGDDVERWRCLRCDRVDAGRDVSAHSAPEPEFDAGGYPTERTLEAIRNWPVAGAKDLDQLLDFMRRAWKYPLLAERLTTPGLWYFATGGWSGNEELLSAFEANPGRGLAREVRLPGGQVILAMGWDAEKRILRAVNAFMDLICQEG